ncbi:helix-turn-helix domain-containing protein [Cupriavidus plantarum]|uniref:AraC family transcriptional regulator n=1 Tax=Cupriavidus plantarum TaxID=942865 RepID=A0A316EYW3_9BURK|nr:helix-turn-helix domain-containing protein [Cupriavidus plantarum]PWK37844.1 AraC family transcriptional regulator [Cupriavidus plantarum]
MDAQVTSLRQWSTDGVPVRSRVAYWTDAIAYALARSEIDFSGAERFQAELSSGDFGALSVSRTRATAGRTVRRTPRCVSADTKDCYHLVTSGRRPWSVVAQAGSIGLQVNDAVLLDSGREYELHVPDDTEIFSIELPRRWMQGWILDADRHVGERIDASSGWSSVLCAFVKQVSVQCGRAIPNDASMLADELGALAARTFNPPADLLTSRSQRVARDALRCVHDRHREAGIGAADIASDLGMSVRTLHRHLATAGTSMSQTLADTRIEAAKQMLKAPSLRTLTVEEIGHRCGYRDVSHFVRQFRQTTAMTPGQFRRATLL